MATANDMVEVWRLAGPAGTGGFELTGSITGGAKAAADAATGRREARRPS